MNKVDKAIWSSILGDEIDIREHTDIQTSPNLDLPDFKG